MAKQSVRSGQRDAVNKTSGQKRRTDTSMPHSGSRSDPSHVTRQKRETRVKKAAQGRK